MVSDGVRSIWVKEFTSIRDAEVELRDLNVLVGANGSGKSNVIRMLELLGRIVDEDLRLFVGLNGGASALLHRPPSTKGSASFSKPHPTSTTPSSRPRRMIN
ncbi:MAG TPA: AAA family ATPase [Mycobacteriales bacterium]|nr:AAA family ATPase [Mycobacteriales bacterium]